MFNPHVSIVLCVVTQIFVTTHVVVPICDAKMAIEGLRRCVYCKANTAFQWFGVHVTLSMLIQLLLAVESNHTNIAYKLTLNLEVAKNYQLLIYYD